MERTWKPVTGGILSIIAGAIGVIGGIIGACFRAAYGPHFPGMVGFGYAVMAIPLIILGAVAIVGGIYALKRKIWGLALAGSICSFFCVWILGIPAIVFIAIGKNEFK